MLKYLVQIRDDIEMGDEKMKELETEMREIGLYDTEFSVGDILEEVEGPGATSETQDKAKQKKKLADFPVVEGEETVLEYIGQYKRACLNRKALLKSTKERLAKDNASGYETLGL